MASRRKENRIDYAEFSVQDIARSKSFYGDAFGWMFKDYGPGYCEFTDGRLTGGFALSGEENLSDNGRRTGPLVILFTKDLDAAKSRVEAAGGKVVQAPYAFPGGRRFHFSDRDGYELAVWSER